MIYFNSDSDRSSRCNIDMQQLCRLREDARQPTDDYFNHSSRLETSRGQASHHRQLVGDKFLLVGFINNRHGFIDNRPPIKLSHLYLFPTCSSQDRLLFWVRLSTGITLGGYTMINYF
jgi:hypothetical protein